MQEVAATRLVDHLFYVVRIYSHSVEKEPTIRL